MQAELIKNNLQLPCTFNWGFVRSIHMQLDREWLWLDGLVSAGHLEDQTKPFC